MARRVQAKDSDGIGWVATVERYLLDIPVLTVKMAPIYGMASMGRVLEFFVGGSKWWVRQRYKRR